MNGERIFEIMRMRRKKHGAERLAACGEYLMPEEFSSTLQIYGTQSPLRIEIGCGKGDFIIGTAQNEGAFNYVAVEKVGDVMVVAAEKVKSLGLTNVRLMRADAGSLDEYFPAHCVDRIYLNFSDPWPKKGYFKRRLTYRGFLEKYKKLLIPGGSIYFKTDDEALFDFSLEELQASGFTVECVTRDLHASEYNEGNVMTEYERNFSSMGKKINHLRAYVK